MIFTDNERLECKIFKVKWLVYRLESSENGWLSQTGLKTVHFMIIINNQ